MSRKTITVSEEAFETAEANQQGGESWSEYLIRTATTEHGPNTVVVENVDEVARRSAEMVEDRMTRR